METMQLITTTTMDLTHLADDAIEALFAEAGLGVEVVAHCGRADCPTCFAPLGAAA